MSLRPSSQPAWNPSTSTRKPSSGLQESSMKSRTQDFKATQSFADSLREPGVSYTPQGKQVKQELQANSRTTTSADQPDYSSEENFDSSAKYFSDDVSLKALNLEQLSSLVEKTSDISNLRAILREITNRWIKSNKDDEKLNTLYDTASKKMSSIYESSSENTSRRSSESPSASGKTPTSQIITNESKQKMTADELDVYQKIEKIQDEDTRRDFLKAMTFVKEGENNIEGLFEALRDSVELITGYQSNGIKLFYSNQEIQSRFGQSKLEIVASQIPEDLKGSYDFVISITDPQKIFLLDKDAGHTAVATSEHEVNNMLFPRGKPVLYAGTIEIESGQLKSWSNASGHYKPDKASDSAVSKTLDLLNAKRNILGSDGAQSKFREFSD